jgi:hypothetical protein
MRAGGFFAGINPPSVESLGTATACTGVTTGWPHAAQKREPSEDVAPHFEQNIVHLAFGTSIF